MESIAFPGVSSSSRASTAPERARSWRCSRSGSNRKGYGTFFSEWNSSALVREVTRRGKKKRMLTPMTFSLIHSTDFADRTEQHIIPPLKAGALVLADRYVYTAFARDVARGVNAGWVRNLYRFAVKPTIAFYFRISVDDAMKRIVGGRDAHQVLRSGNGSTTQPGHRRELSPLPGRRRRGVRPHGRGIRLRRDRREPLD